MARLLIEVETKGVAEARREMGQLENSIKGVEGTSKTGTQSLDDMLKTIGQMRVEADGLGKTIQTGPTRSFTGMIAESGAARMALLGVGTAFVGLLAESARYYASQQNYMEVNKRGINELALAWGNFRYRVGEALLGSEQDMSRHLSVLARFVNSAGSMLSGLIRASGIAGGSAAGAAGLIGFGYGQDLVAIGASGGAITNPTVRRASDLMLRPTTGAAAWGGASALGPNGLPLDAIDQAWARDRARIEDSFNKTLESASERRRRAEEKAASEAERLATRWAYVSQSVRGMPSGVIDASTAIFDPFLPPPAYLPSSPLPGGGMSFLPMLGEASAAGGGGGASWLSSLFGRGGLGSQAMSFLTGTGLLTRNTPLGRSIGGAMTGFGLGAGVSGLMSSLVGASVWGPLAPVAAGVGAVIPFLGRLFGPSAKAREDAAIQPQIDALIQQTIAQYGGMAGLQSAQSAAGVDVTGAFGSRGAQGLSELTSLVEQLAQRHATLNQRLAEQVSLEARLAALREEQKVTWEEAASVINRYGLNIAGLGPSVRQGQTTASATQLLNDMQTLFDFGADVGGVLSGLSGQISALVGQSAQFGTAIPENFRPFIEELLRSGQLLDANGQALTDLSGIRWGDRVATEAEKMTSAIEELSATLRDLIESIKNDFPNAVKQGVEEGQRIIDGTVWEVPDISVPGTDVLGVATGGYIGAGGVMYAARGGRVRHPGRARGTDTVPAWLTPGEFVMSREAVNRIGVGTLSRMNSGSTLNVGGIHIDARDGIWDNPAAAERVADRVERVLMTRIKPHLQYSRY